LHLFFYTSLIVSYFTNIFLHSQLLTYIIGILVLICIVISFNGSTRLFQVSGTIFFLIGLYLFFHAGYSIAELPYYVTSTVSILAILYVVPFINSVIVVGRYDRSVSKLLNTDIRHLGQLYYRGSLVTFVLGGFLNLATIPLVESILQKNLKGQARELKNKLIARMILRGYAVSLIITPMEVLVAISIDITHISYQAFIPWLVLISCIILILDWSLGWKLRSYSLEGPQGKRQEKDTTDILKKMAHLFFFLILFIVIVISTNHFFQFGFLPTVTLVIIPYSLIWALLIGRLKSYLAYCLPVWKQRTVGLQNYMFLFLSVGLFTFILKETDFVRYVHGPVESLMGTPILLFIAIQVLFLGLAMVGFHPLVTISILGSVLEPVVTTLNPLSVAIVLVTSGLATVMAGPFNVSVSLVGSLLQVNPYQVSWWNLGHAFLFGGIGTIIGLLLL